MDAPVCPKCGEPMTEGHTVAQGIHWLDRGESLRLWRPAWWKWNALPNTWSWIRPAANPAWRCAECQMVLVDHSRPLGSDTES